MLVFIVVVTTEMAIFLIGLLMRSSDVRSHRVTNQAVDSPKEDQ